MYTNAIYLSASAHQFLPLKMEGRSLFWEVVVKISKVGDRLGQVLV